MARYFRWLLLLTVVSLVLLSMSSASSAEDRTSANNLLRSVVQNELKTQAADHSHWMYRSTSYNSNGQRQQEVIQTRDGELDGLLSVDRHPPTAAQEQNSERKIQHLLHDPQEQRKHKHDEQHDSQETEHLLRVLPQAVTASYGKTSGDLTELDFKPNPNFNPSSHEEQVFHSMQGKIWVNTKEKRIVRIQGYLSHEVKFGWGLLGHLDKGGKFQVVQSEVAPGHWEVTSLHIDMNGKALFFKTIGVHENKASSDFQRVPDDFTLAQAAAELRKDMQAARQQDTAAANGASNSAAH